MLQDTARRVAKVVVECKIGLDPQQYVEGFRWGRGGMEGAEGGAAWGGGLRKGGVRDWLMRC